MNNRFISLVEENKIDFYRYLNLVISNNNKLLVKGNLLDIFREFKSNNNGQASLIEEAIDKIIESVCMSNKLYLEVREDINISAFFLFNVEEKYYEEISELDYLKAQEQFVEPGSNGNILTLDFKPFYDKFPSIRQTKSIGHGVEYLNRYLSSRMFNEPEKFKQALFDFIFVHRYKNQPLILNDRIKNTDQLILNIDRALKLLWKKDDDEPYNNFRNDLQNLGFEPGLGNTAGLISLHLQQLDRLMHSPDHIALKEFISSIPMIYNIAIISPHGYFGQQNVLGKPDTGGQVVYILDQVRAIENQLLNSLAEAGLDADPKILILTRLIPNAGDTDCNLRIEKVHNSKNTFILRIPFRNKDNQILQNWITRFEVWPYLEYFAEDAYKELLAELGGRPDFIIGNYSDGNMVASILAKKFGVTQCNIAHALEKSKYLYSGLYWKNLEQFYNFSVQFIADLYAMNSANFIITSTFQEIAGTEEGIGQYESYSFYTMPGLYRVKYGVNLSHPKFNILPPGVNTVTYFPFTNEQERIKETTNEIETLIFGSQDEPDIFGKLSKPELIPIFTLARLDKIKNLTALAKWFGMSSEMQEKANLVIVAGKIDSSLTPDIEEKEQIDLMHSIINEHNLSNKIRWIGKLFRKDQSGEVYRVIADHKGIFVQPALFEGLGLTVLEAMRSGLPVFATKYGGPQEIIEDERSGFHIDPVNAEETTIKIISFLDRIKKDPAYWDKISSRAIQRVDHEYNWKNYAASLISLANIYGFWKFTSNIEMTEMNAYLDVIYHLLYKPRVDDVLHRTSHT
ncbi:MAG: sucrose synthase [Ignavibacteriaceae bacterium]|nr:sucrose synthase [Ignavibacteriaceae bacterium]